MNFRHKIVQDLAWIIGSAPLMAFDPKLQSYQRLTSDWFQHEEERCHDFLLEQDAHPEPLENFLAEGDSKLLGKRFERYIEFWLRHSGRFEILLCNKPIKREKRTIGEIDYVIREMSTGEIWHLEVACKYYLGRKNSSLWTNWIGPNGTDSLDEKMNKFSRQLNIFNGEEGRALLQRERITQPKSFLLMKGYFFYDFDQTEKHKSPKTATQNHNTGLYIRESELNRLFSGKGDWAVLSKRNWFAPFGSLDAVNIYRHSDIGSAVKGLLKKYGRSIMIARISIEENHYREDLRVVVVKNSWPEA